MHNLLPHGAFYFSAGPALQLLRDQLGISSIDAAQHEWEEVAIEHSGGPLGAKDPFCLVGSSSSSSSSSALSAVLCDLGKDGLQVRMGFGHGVVRGMAGRESATSATAG